MNFIVVPVLFSSFICFAQLPISDARMMRSGKIISVTGTITAVFGDLSFIQDRTGGIAVYKANVSLNDSASITGTLSKHNGMLEIIADSIEFLGKGLPVHARSVALLYDHEGELVRLENILLEPQGLFFYPQHAGLIIRHSDTAQYWIDENTDIPGYTIPAVTSMTGIVGKFGNTLQLLPRSYQDIDDVIIHGPLENSHFKVVNWNVEFFGAARYGPPDDSLQIANVAEVLNSTQPDIVALQEISSDDAFRSLLKLFPGYEGRCSSRYSYSFDTSGDFPPQKVCFVYKTSTVRVIREEILFRKWFDDHPSDIFSGGRLPYLLEVDAMGHRLVLVNLHAKSGADEQDFVRRQSDSKMLQDSLDTSTDLILLGDLNDDLDESIVAGRESTYSNFVADDRYSCISKTLSDNGWHSTISYDDMIDHQIITIGLNERHVSTQVLNPFEIPLYARTTSDHVPIISEFDLTKVVTGVFERERPLIYPNPTSDDVWFPPNSDITIVNSMGEIIIKKAGAYPPISLDEYAPGLYSVVLWNQVFKIVRN